MLILHCPVRPTNYDIQSIVVSILERKRNSESNVLVVEITQPVCCRLMRSENRDTGFGISEILLQTRATYQNKMRDMFAFIFITIGLYAMVSSLVEDICK